MTIGIPKALLYYQYAVLWETFFTYLGCDVVISDTTNEAVVQNGARDSISECCLPAKTYLGHVNALLSHCDYILSPYAVSKYGGDAICTRFWGIGDVIRHTYPTANLLEYALHEGGYKPQYKSFRAIGKKLGKRSGLTRSAYETAVQAQNLHDKNLQQAQSSLLLSDGLKVLLAGRSYVMHDPYIGGTITDILSDLGCITIFSDHFDRKDTIRHASDISPRLYWTASQAAIGAIAAHKKNIDGVLMLTTFPCAPDALAFEMAARVVKDVPIALILLDGLHGEAGLYTRIESFIDILSSKKPDGGKAPRPNTLSYERKIHSE